LLRRLAGSHHQQTRSGKQPGGQSHDGQITGKAAGSENVMTSHTQGSHAGHSHGAMTNEKRVATAFVLIALFMLVEIVGGLLSGSLALLADAGHMVSDAAALAMSWLALRVGRRPADAARSFGYRRLEVLAAFANGCALFLIAGWVVFEAVSRFAQPVPVLGGPMLAVAVAGTVANLIAFWVMSGGERENLNMRSAWLHILGDLFGSAAAVLAAGIILWTGWQPIDPILSIVVALVILKSAYEIVRSSAHILLEGTPDNLNIAALKADLDALLLPGVEVHHLHAWSLASDKPLITLHVSGVADGASTTVLATIQAYLKEKHSLAHSTIQIDPAEQEPAET
jgi:cobalt-zinc-cadmium efflux system protein